MSIAISVLVWQKVTLNIVFIINQRTFVFSKKDGAVSFMLKTKFQASKG